VNNINDPVATQMRPSTLDSFHDGSDVLSGYYGEDPMDRYEKIGQFVVGAMMVIGICAIIVSTLNGMSQ
jgi:hypothetical protein